MEKYGKAIELTRHIDRVRKDYTSKIKSKDISERQLGKLLDILSQYF